MTFLNIHTHTPLHEDERTILSLGLHPWHIQDDWQEHLHRLDNELAGTFSHETLENSGTAVPTIIIGECGLDHLCSTPYDLQLEVFQEHIRLSENYQCPLILHCVRAIDDVLRLKRGTQQPWIFHGFRGKPQQLLQLLSHGFYVSFGFHYNADSLRSCPASRLFLETDDIPNPILPLYEEASQLRNTTVEMLQEQMWENLNSLRKGSL